MGEFFLWYHDSKTKSFPSRRENSTFSALPLRRTLFCSLRIELGWVFVYWQRVPAFTWLSTVFHSTVCFMASPYCLCFIGFAQGPFFIHIRGSFKPLCTRISCHRIVVMAPGHWDPGLRRMRGIFHSSSGQQILTEHLPCARLCSWCWECANEHTKSLASGV